MNIDEILELMDELLDKSSSVPFGTKKMIDAEQMHEYIDSIRLNMPGEIKQAKDTAKEKKKIIDEANVKAEKIIREAEDKAKVLVSEQEVLKQAAEYARKAVTQANEQAAEIIEQAKVKEQAIRKALSDNIAKSLNEASKVLTKNLEAVNSTKDAISKIAE